MSSETYFNDGNQAFADLFNSLKSSLYNGKDDDDDDDPPKTIFVNGYLFNGMAGGKEY